MLGCDGLHIIKWRSFGSFAVTLHTWLDTTACFGVKHGNFFDFKPETPIAWNMTKKKM